MYGELARKQPANTVQGTLPGPVLPRPETIIRPSRQAVLAELGRLAKRGEVGSTYRLIQTPDGWALKVMRIKEPRRSAWRHPLTAAGLVVLGLWALVVLVKLVAPLVPWLVAGMVILGTVKLIGPRTMISIVQSIVIKR